jgi:hypothetical protein
MWFGQPENVPITLLQISQILLVIETNLKIVILDDHSKVFFITK